MKKGFPVNLFFGIFLAVGIGLLAGSFAMFKSTSDFKKIADEVSARIIRIEEYYDSDNDLRQRVYVTYSYNGTVYDDVPINFYSSSMFEGKEITLLCDPEHPKRLREASVVDFAGLILLIMGLAFSLVGGIPIALSIKKSVQAKQLLKSGYVLHAVVDRVEFNTSYSVNGRHPYVIYCNYRDEYKDVTYLFKSDNLWTDPLPIFPPGSDIEVLVDPKDYSKYHVKAEAAIEQKIIDYT